MTKYINEFADAWLDTLETTDLKQGKGFLCQDEAYCCLGVAEEIYGERDGVFNGRVSYKDKVFPTRCVLSTEQRDLLGLRSTEGAAAQDFRSSIGYHDRLTGANDDGVSFKELAEIIRAQPEIFFKPVSEQVMPWES